MSSLPTIAIAGATGNLGAKIASVFLRPEFRSRFQDIVLLSRSAHAPAAQALVDAGGILRTYDERNLQASLQDVTVVINA